MPKTITALTPEQEARMPEWVEKWTKIGLSTEPADFDRAEAAGRACYRATGIPEPFVVIRAGSPYATTLGGVLSVELLKRLDVFMNGIEKGKIKRPDDFVPTWDIFTDYVQTIVPVEKQTFDQIMPVILEDKVKDPAFMKDAEYVWHQVFTKIKADVIKDAKENAHKHWVEYRSAQLWASWYAYITFFRDVCDWENEKLEMFAHDEALALTCGWTWWNGAVLSISDRPRKIEFDEEKRLHCENGPAIRYPDGWSIYCWHGTSVPDHWITNRDNLDPVEIIKNTNVEMRAVGAEIVGWPKMLTTLNVKVINDSGSDDIGQLIEMTLPGLNRPGRFLKAVCPRNGVIVEGVPYVSDIDNKPIETAIAAQAWRIGDPQSEYEHPPMRT